MIATFWAAIANGAILSLLLTFAIWLALRLIPRTALNAATRYAIWWMVLAITILLPLALIPRDKAPGPSSSLSQPQRAIALKPAARPLAESAPLKVPGIDWQRPLLLTWIACSLLLLLRLALSHRGLRRVAREALTGEALTGDVPAVVNRWLTGNGSTRGPVTIRISDRIPIPAAQGPIQPSILLPAKLISGLSSADLETICLHEAAHIVRRDDQTLLLQRIVEALFALHPAVRWITTRLDLEREIACDDMVVGAAVSTHKYADCLLRAVALCGAVRPAIAVARVAENRNQLSARIELLASKKRGAHPNLSARSLFVTGATALAIALALTRTPRLLAFPAPQTLEERLDIAATQLSAREIDAAIASYQAALPQTIDDRSRAKVLDQLANAYRQKGDTASTTKYTEEALLLGPDNPAIVTNAAIFSESQGNAVRALALYRRAISLDPRNPLAKNNAAFLIAETNGDLDEALGLAEDARALIPNFLEAVDTISWIYLKQGNSAGAAAELQTLIEKAPKNPIYRYHYAMALARQNRTAEALAMCDEALALNSRADIAADIHALAAQLRSAK